MFCHTSGRASPNFHSISGGLGRCPRRCPISSQPCSSFGQWEKGFHQWVKLISTCNFSIWYGISTNLNTLGPRQHRRRFADDIFKCIFFNENCCVLIKTSLKYVGNGPIDNPALVQIMAWRRLGDKPLSEPMMVSLLMHICVARPQWKWEWYWCSTWCRPTHSVHRSECYAPTNGFTRFSTDCM